MTINYVKLGFCNNFFNGESFSWPQEKLSLTMCCASLLCWI